MAVTYRFPIPREDRVAILVAAILTLGIWAGLARALAVLALTADMSVGDLFAASRSLRASVAAMALVSLASLYSLWAYARIKSGARLEVGDETVTYVRPPLPLLGTGRLDVCLPASALDAIDVELRRIPAPHRALRVAAGRAEICVNLDHAVRVDPSTRAARRGDWQHHPLVSDLRAVAPPRLASPGPDAG